MERPLTQMLSQHRILLLDGAMGTELQRRGCTVELPLWSAHALFDCPELVAAIHQDYLRAGADILTTNTFRTTPRTFHRAGIPDRSQALTAIAVTLAHQARARYPDRAVLIAGSMAPLEDCYRPDLVPPDDTLRAEHRQHARALAAAGVDFFLVETMATLREAFAACSAARETGKEAVVSFLCDSSGNLYSGESLAEAVRTIRPLQPTAFSVNCVSPRHIGSALAALHGATDLPLAVYANVGISGHEQAQRFVCDTHPREYAEYAAEWIRDGATIVGGCCGTTPEHIQALHDLLSSPNTTPRTQGNPGETMVGTSRSTRARNTP